MEPIYTISIQAGQATIQVFRGPSRFHALLLNSPAERSALMVTSMMAIKKLFIQHAEQTRIAAAGRLAVGETRPAIEDGRGKGCQRPATHWRG